MKVWNFLVDVVAIVVKEWLEYVCVKEKIVGVIIINVFFVNELKRFWYNELFKEKEL